MRLMYGIIPTKATVFVVYPPLKACFGESRRFGIHPREDVVLSVARWYVSPSKQWPMLYVFWVAFFPSPKIRYQVTVGYAAGIGC